MNDRLWRLALPAGSFILAAILPTLNPDPYVLVIVLANAYIFALYAMSWNLLALSGQASLGHAAFLGLGAYASVLLSEKIGLPVYLTILVGPSFSAAVGLGLGALCLRLREWFLAMVTFGFAVIVETVVVDFRLTWLTNGWTGLTTISLVPPTFESPHIWKYYIALATVALTYSVARILIKSKIGLALRTIQQNEIVARTCGVKSLNYKLLAFLLSTYMAGVAGALQYHIIFPHISPEVFAPQISFWPLIFTLAGGIGTPEGPIVGSLLIWVFWEAFRSVGGFYSPIAVGTFLAFLIIFLPGGLISLIARYRPGPTKTGARQS